MSKEIDLNNIDDVDEALPSDLAKARGDLVESDTDDTDTQPPAAKTAEPTAKTVIEGENGEGGEADEELETEEERLEREALEAEEEKRKRIRVPKARLDEESAKRKRAEQELEALRAQLLAQQREQEAAKAPKGPTVSELETELDALEEQYEDAVINGEKETARKLRSEIRNKRDVIMESRVTVKADEARSAAYEQVQFDNFVRATQEAYPSLDSNHADYNPEIESDVIDIAEAYLSKGKSRIEALTKAVKYVLGNKSAVEESAPAKKASLTRSIDTADKQTQVKQPPSLKQAGDSGDKQPSLAKLPEQDFNKLTEAELRAARGDTLE